MEKLEERIKYSFKNRELLETALTHSSYANEKHTESYERLEFLGDSILGFVTAEFLYSHDPELPEGRMTRLRSELVCETSLHNIAKQLEIGKYMLVGRGEEKNGGRKRVSVLADMVESIIAALYLDAGLDEAKRFIYEMLLNNADLSEVNKAVDCKSELQEMLQKNGAVEICYYEISESGPDHNKTFISAVSLDGREIGRGSGKTKKESEEAAASRALEELRK